MERRLTVTMSGRLAVSDTSRKRVVNVGIENKE